MKTIKMSKEEIHLLTINRRIELIRPAKIKGMARFSGCDDAEPYVMKGKMPVPAKCEHGVENEVLRVRTDDPLQDTLDNLYVRVGHVKARDRDGNGKRHDWLMTVWFYDMKAEMAEQMAVVKKFIDEASEHELEALIEVANKKLEGK